MDKESAPPLPPRYEQVEPNPQWSPDQKPQSSQQYDHDPSSPIHFSRDPSRLTAYLVPFPIPQTRYNVIYPLRFLIYTPPAPPLSEPDGNEEESRTHKMQRKRQHKIREAKTSTAKTASFHGIKSKATKGIDWAMGQTKTSDLEFLGRVDGYAANHAGYGEDQHADEDAEHTKKTVGLDEMLLVYPASMNGTPEQIREEFVNTMLRSKSKAQRDAVIATGMLPVSLAIDILVFPIPGLIEVDSVWLYASSRGAKTVRSVTKRLTSTSTDEGQDDAQLRLNFLPTPHLELLQQYLIAECHAINPQLFRQDVARPSESDMLEAIGWTPSEKGGVERNWEDEQWEISEVKEDLKSVMHKGAKEWHKWCKAFEKDPVKMEKSKK